MRIAVQQMYVYNVIEQPPHGNSGAALYLAIRQVKVARDITELLIAKLANAALQLEACEGASHAPEPDMPCAYIKQVRGISLSDGLCPKHSRAGCARSWCCHHAQAEASEA